MSEMIERVARALWNDMNLDIPWGFDEERNYLGHARAAIEAIREPTAAMLFVGANDEAGFTQRNILQSWQLMIDEALK
jgi:hypothetical protein